jgi:hypothetical protein
MDKIKVKLNEDYGNDFLALQSGSVFYRKSNRLDRVENIVEVSLDNFEARQLINQNILVPVEEVDDKVDKIIKEQSNGVKTPKIAKETPIKEKIMIDKPVSESAKVIKEVKTFDNDKVIDDLKNN